MSLVKALGVEFFNEKFAKGVFVVNNIPYVTANAGNSRSTSEIRDIETQLIRLHDRRNDEFLAASVRRDATEQYQELQVTYNVLLAQQQAKGNKKNLAISAFNLSTGTLDNVDEDLVPDVMPYWEFSRPYTIFKMKKGDVFGLKSCLEQSPNGHRCLKIEQRAALAKSTGLTSWQKCYGFYVEDERYKSILTTEYHTKDEVLKAMAEEGIDKSLAHVEAAITPSLTVMKNIGYSENAFVRYKDYDVIKLTVDNKVVAVKEKLVAAILPTNPELGWFL